MIEVADRELRDRALLPEQSFIVGAPAGSGKTTLLTQRFLRLLSLVPQPESIVAITFTRKAAAEMSNRILDALRAAKSPSSDLDPVTRTWALAALQASETHDWRLIESPRRLRVQTIDALSATLARRGPLLSGYAGDVAVLENADVLYAQAARATITELETTGSAWSGSVRTLLKHLDNDWVRLEGLLAVMLSRRDQWLRLVVAAPERAAFEGALASVVESELRRIVTQLPAHCRDDLRRLAAYAGTNLARDKPEDRRVQLAGIEALPPTDLAALESWQAIVDVLLTKSGTWRQRLTKAEGFPPGGPVAEFKAVFASLTAAFDLTPTLCQDLQALRGLPLPVYQQWEWDGIEALFSVLKLGAAHLKLIFDETGAVDFAEVSRSALAALGQEQDPSDLQLLLDYEIRHLLIDEFQDTSISQFELVKRLVDGWSDGDGRTLFIVGDPMQSIYRFREAEVDLFLDTATAGHIGAVPLVSLQLTTNFRSQAGLVDWVNETIAGIGETRACPFSALPRLIAARPEAQGGSVFLHGLLAEDYAGEARVVAEIVKRTRADSPEQRIGILVRSRNHLGAISAELAAAGIEVSASEIDRLDAQAVVQDLVALTRALLHPADRTAWLAVLRAPWCGLSLAALGGLFERADPLTIHEQLHLPAADDPILPAERAALGACRNVLDRALARVGRIPTAVLVEQTWLALNGPSMYPAEALRQAERYFELLDDYASRADLVTPQGLAEMLGRYYLAPPPHAHAQVDIMTIHGAKGLEFDCVILPGLNRIPRSDPRRILEWRNHFVEGSNHLLFAPITRIGDPDSPIFEFLRNAEKRDGDDEAYRLLYVALTRARESLHLVATVKRNEDGDPAPPAARSFLGMLWPAVAATMPFVEAAPGARPAAAPAASQLVRRLVSIPAGTPGPLVVAGADHVTPSGEVEFSWASPVAKHIGTIAHALLQQVGADGLSRWDMARVQRLRPLIASRLRGAGVEQTAIDAAVERIVTALLAVLTSERGRWVFDGRHGAAASEYGVTAVMDGYPFNAIIDRTFVDEGGTRWIIDFKTGEHRGGAREAFIASEVERYRPQLERYAQVMRGRETRPIRLGLFFPMLDDWVEWAFDG